MLEQLFFITVSVAIFGIMFYKMIKKNETGYIYLLILGALGIIIDGIGIVANVNANIFLKILTYIMSIIIPGAALILEYKNIDVINWIKFAQVKFYLSTGDLKKAKDILLTIIEKNPNNYNAHKFLAEIYEKEGGIRKAIDEYVRCIEINKKDYDSYYKVALLLNDLEKKDEAIEMLYGLIDKKPDYYNATVTLGDLLIETEKYKEAVSILTEALKYNPTSFDLNYGLGMAYTMLNDFQSAKECYEKAAEILKKEMGDNLKEFSNQEKAMVIMALRDKYPVKSILEVFDMAKSSYCYQQKQIKKENKIAKIKERIKILFFENHKRYGYRRIHLLLKREGIIISEKIVRSIMKEENLIVRAIRQKKYSSYLGEISPAVPNEVQRDFHADKPNKKWLTDITEFKIGEEKVYLSPIIDCFDGMPITWTVGTSPNAELVNTMLDNAIALLKGNEHPIVHSDRGCHYRWPGWIQRMNEAGLTRSMSKKGCSPDNSACEGFFGRMKNEMFYGEKWDKISVEEFISIINQYMQWYRDKRIKLSLGGLSPMEYRRSLGIA